MGTARTIAVAVAVIWPVARAVRSPAGRSAKSPQLTLDQITNVWGGPAERCEGSFDSSGRALDPAVRWIVVHWWASSRCFCSSSQSRRRGSPPADVAGSASPGAPRAPTVAEQPEPPDGVVPGPVPVDSQRFAPISGRPEPPCRECHSLSDRVKFDAVVGPTFWKSTLTRILADDRRPRWVRRRGLGPAPRGTSMIFQRPEPGIGSGCVTTCLGLPRTGKSMSDQSWPGRVGRLR